jgi:hypothetical protein
MRFYADTRHLIQDLAICVLRNKTKHDFITSDDPSLMTNRFHFQRLLTSTFGLASAGTQFFMPVSPKLAVVAYDKGVYTVVDKIGDFADVTKVDDVRAINELQYLNASENIYFSNWSERDRLLSEIQDAATNRTDRWTTISVLVPDGSTERGQRYRHGTDLEVADAKRRLFVSSSIFPRPKRWCSRFSFRNPLKAYSNGSGAGWVRQKEFLERRV